MFINTQEKILSFYNGTDKIYDDGVSVCQMNKVE